MNENSTKSVAVIGASNDRRKFGNKAVRAYLREGWTVHPVNPTERQIEGLPAYRSVTEVPRPIDRISVYVPPDIGLSLLPGIARAGEPEVWFNPGAESEAILERGRELGLNIIVACSIVAIGQEPE